MFRVKGRYRNRKVELDTPLELPEGAEVELEVRAIGEELSQERDAWSALGIQRLEEEWDNPKDAIYDEWRKLYGAEPR